MLRILLLKKEKPPCASLFLNSAMIINNIPTKQNLKVAWLPIKTGRLKVSILLIIIKASGTVLALKNIAAKEKQKKV